MIPRKETEIRKGKSQEGSKHKKQKVSCGKEFRTKLKCEAESLQALKDFNGLSSESKSELIIDYLEHGGSCLEILQLLEKHPTSLPVIQVSTDILLNIISKYPQHQNKAEEASRYLINNHVSTLNKMLGIKASTRDRNAILKLLTVLVSLSASLAKDILAQISFNRDMLDLATRPNNAVNKSARINFIHFLIAFLVDGHWPMMSALIEKRELLTSIMHNLQFDSAETVCLVLTTLREKILEDSFIMKTTKMHIFSTPVVRDLVGLYNWKGPENYDTKTKTVVKQPVVNEEEKSKVVETLHEFLLVLCTSINHGIIFRDHSFGTGKRSRNNLMVTVLDHLERPWDNKYTAELVIKICYACPDLTRTMWQKLKPFLEPRASKKWLDVIGFAEELVKILQPSSIAFCVRKMDGSQIFSAIQTLIAPAYIIKTICVANFKYDSSYVKHRCIIFLITLLDTINSYKNYCHNLVSNDEHKQLQNLLNDYIFKCFPNAQNAMNNWEIFETSEVNDLIEDSIEKIEHLKTIIKLLDMYNKCCPQLCNDLTSIVDLNNLLKNINECANIDLQEDVIIKVVKLYIDIDPQLFSFEKDAFELVLRLLVKNYISSESEDSMEILKLIFLQSDVFEGCLQEIDIWLKSILYVKIVNEIDMCNFLTIALKNSRCNLHQHLSEIGGIRQALVNNESLDSFDDYDYFIDQIKQSKLNNHLENKIMHIHLSPFICSALQTAIENKYHKSINQYLNVAIVNLTYRQTDPLLITNLIKNEKYASVVSQTVKDYCVNITTFENNVVPVEKLFNSKSFIPAFSDAFINNKMCTELFENFAISTKECYDLMNIGIFYFTQMLKFNKLDEQKYENFIQFFMHFLKKSLINVDSFIEIIGNHPVILLKFSPTSLAKNNSSGYCTKFFLTILTETYENKSSYEKYLYSFRFKTVASVVKTLKNIGKLKSSKCNELMKLIEVFGFSMEQCKEILNNICEVQLELFVSKDNTLSIAYNLLVYCLEKYVQFYDSKDPLHSLSEEIISKITKIFVYLENRPEQLNLENFALVIRDYLLVYPHNIKHVDDKLFEVLIRQNNLYKSYCVLATLLLERDFKLTNVFLENIKIVSNKKGLVLPLTKAAIFHNIDDAELKKVYDNFEHSILKALAKPHKAGIYFEEFYDVISILIEKFMPQNVCNSFATKLSKYDSSEEFHVNLLCVIYEKLFFTLQHVDEKHVTNAVLTLIHILINMLKKKSDQFEDNKVNAISVKINTLLEKLYSNETFKAFKYKLLVENETLKLFTKFCLKYGISGKSKLLKVLSSLNILITVTENDANLIMEMILSHSEFLELVLGKDSPSKTAVFEIVLTLCEKNSNIMARNHIPIWLSAYNASMSVTDKTILNILKRYEENRAQTNFYDFKPFLWGQKATNHYSLRSDIQNTLWRQPRTGEILDILNLAQVQKTILNFPIDRTLNTDKIDNDIDDEDIYDPAFLLPLFNSLLAHESEIQTYKFTKSGALSIVVSALACNNKNMRLAACNVLARLNFHLEAKKHGKDKLLWLHFVEAVGKGTAVLEEFKLGSFAALFLSKMALILIEPLNPLYIPLTQYLSAKETLDLSGIPEIYTLLDSADVNHLEYQRFILETLRDGLRTNADINVMMHTMAFKFIMDSANSIVSSNDFKVLIMEIICKACSLPQGMKLLIKGYGLLPWMFSLLQNLQPTDTAIAEQIISFCIIYSKCKENLTAPHVYMFNMIVRDLLKNLAYLNVNENCILKFLDTVYIIQCIHPDLVTKNCLLSLTEQWGTNFCKYLLQYGSIHAELLENVIACDINNSMKKLCLKYILETKEF